MDSNHIEIIKNTAKALNEVNQSNYSYKSSQSYKNIFHASKSEAQLDCSASLYSISPLRKPINSKVPILIFLLVRYQYKPKTTTKALFYNCKSA